MKKWYIEDDCGTEIWTDEMKAQTKEEAVEELRSSWNRLTAHDQKRRNSFRAVCGELGEDGCLDYDSITDEVTV